LSIFTFSHLLEQTTPRGFSQELERLEKSLDETSPFNRIYDRAMDIIKLQPKKRRDLAFKVLSWLVMARQVLDLRQLQMAVSMEKETVDFDDQEDLPEISTLIEVCASLVTIDENSNTIRLAHCTIQQYLELNPTFSQEAKTIVSISCTTFLSLNNFRPYVSGTISPKTEELVMLLEEYPLLGYALDLPYHITTCSDEALPIESLLKFLNTDNIKIFNKPITDVLCPNLMPLEPEITNPLLHLAATLGNLSAARILVKYFDINGFTIMGYTPLHHAVLANNISMVRFLLDEGADVSLKNKHGNNVLHLAIGAMPSSVDIYSTFGPARYESRLVVQRFWAYCGPNGVSFAPIAGVFTPDSLPIVKLLLEYGADPNATNYFGWSALRNSVIRLNKDLIDLLLEYALNLNAKDFEVGAGPKYAKRKLNTKICSSCSELRDMKLEMSFLSEYGPRCPWLIRGKILKSYSHPQPRIRVIE
jgi:hypothetical protein